MPARCAVLLRTTAGARRALFLPIVLAALLLPPAWAAGQISSDQVRQRYDKNTKGSSIDDFIKRLESDDAEKRLEAVKSLGTSKDPKAIEYLVQAIGDPDIRVQVKAIDVLGDLRATEATPILIQYLSRRTTEANMKQLILAALGKIGDPRAAQPIMEFLHRDLDRATRGTAIFALGEIGAPESVETLTQIANTDSDPTLRRIANDALNKVQYHQAAVKREVKGPAQTFLEPKDQPPQQ